MSCCFNIDQRKNKVNTIFSFSRHISLKLFRVLGQFQGRVARLPGFVSMSPQSRSSRRGRTGDSLKPFMTITAGSLKNNFFVFFVSTMLMLNRPKHFKVTQMGLVKIYLCNWFEVKISIPELPKSCLYLRRSI